MTILCHNLLSLLVCSCSLLNTTIRSTYLNYLKVEEEERPARRRWYWISTTLPLADRSWTLINRGNRPFSNHNLLLLACLSDSAVDHALSFLSDHLRHSILFGQASRNNWSHHNARRTFQAWLAGRRPNLGGRIALNAALYRRGTLRSFCCAWSKRSALAFPQDFTIPLTIDGFDLMPKSRQSLLNVNWKSVLDKDVDGLKLAMQARLS